MAAILPAGMRAISTPIREETAAGGFILPNDRVDVILSRKSRWATRTTTVSETVLRNVRVLAIGQTLEQQGAKRWPPARLPRSSSPRAQTETLALAQSLGEISLSLRSLADATPGSRGDRQDRRRL